MEHPKIIQGGMGAGVSNWTLAREVAANGHLGVVSGTAMDVLLVRRLQAGDEGGHMRRALAALPIAGLGQRIIDDYFIEGGAAHRSDFKNTPMPTANPSKEYIELVIAGNFCEVYLAKEGHTGKVGINLLTKIQVANIPALYGAMLAGLDYVIMGAGIPRDIPAILDKLAEHQPVSMNLIVDGAGKDDVFSFSFTPADFPATHVKLIRPYFLAIVSSNILATTMVKKATGKVDGLVLEGPTAGGHNAPPRGGMVLDEMGEPIYGEKDAVDIEKIAALGVPFWMAGSFGDSGKLKEALALGAAGVQVGTAFAFCRESGLTPELKTAAIAKAVKNEGVVKTDPLASPTGFPFKVLNLEGTMSELSEYLKRQRLCNLGFLRHLYKKADGVIGYRCPAEPEKAYVAKGGDIEDTKGRKCLCNALVANIGLAFEHKNGYWEKPLLTVGNCFNMIREFVNSADFTYSAMDVINYLLADTSFQTA